MLLLALLLGFDMFLNVFNVLSHFSVGLFSCLLKGETFQVSNRTSFFFIALEVEFKPNETSSNPFKKWILMDNG